MQNGQIYPVGSCSYIWSFKLLCLLKPFPLADLEQLDNGQKYLALCTSKCLLFKGQHRRSIEGRGSYLRRYWVGKGSSEQPGKLHVNMVVVDGRRVVRCGSAIGESVGLWTESVLPL